MGQKKVNMRWTLISIVFVFLIAQILGLEKPTKGKGRPKEKPKELPKAEKNEIKLKATETGPPPPPKKSSKWRSSKRAKTKPKCDYNCEVGDNGCTHKTTYPHKAWSRGECRGTNCAGDTKECGKCYEHCDNIRTEPKCDYDCKNDYECSHRMDHNGRWQKGGCVVWGWEEIQKDCAGVSEECPSCYEKCFASGSGET